MFNQWTISARRRRSRPWFWLLATLTCATTALAVRPGDLATKWAVNDDDPSAGIPSVEERNRDPLEFAYLLQDLLLRAHTAYDAENWEASVKYYEALAKAVPDVARSFSRLCVAYAKLGKQDVAAAYCAKATTLPGARVFDHLRFADLTLRKAKLSNADVSAVEASLNHLRSHAAEHPQALPGEPSRVLAAPPEGQRPETGEELMKQVREAVAKRRQASQAGAPSAATEPTDALPDLETEQDEPEAVIHLPTEIERRACQLAVLTGNEQKLDACLDALRSNKLDERLLLPFVWSQALLRRDEEAASRLLEQARGLGLSSDALDAMRKEQRRVFGHLHWLWGLLAGVVLIAGGVMWSRRRTRLSAASPPAPPPPITNEATATPEG